MTFDPQTLEGLSSVNQEVFFNEDVTFYGRVNLDKVVISGSSISFSKNIEFTGGEITVKKLNSADIITQNINAGISTFQDIYINGKLYDGDGDFGTAGQVLSSDGTNLDWINTSSANVGSATNVGTNLNSDNSDQYVTFVGASSGNNPTRVDTQIRYNPSSNTLKVTNLQITGINGNGVIPSGGIIMWSGSLTNVPAGWSICDGNNGTPDLRNRFIVGVGTGGNYSVGDTGGSDDAIVVKHNHSASTSTSISPTSVLSAANGGPTILAGASSGTSLNYSTATSASSSTTVNDEGSSGTGANRPPYYALAYIMKL